MPGATVTDVLLLDLPVPLWEAARVAGERLVAALAPYAASHPRGPAARLVKAAGRMNGTFAEVAAPSELELRAAAARRLKQLDVAYGVPSGARDDVAELAAAYDAAERYCRDHDLAELVAPPEVAAFRRWFLGEIVAQLDGGFPTPWRGAPSATS
jgi:hypothetical protein